MKALGIIRNLDSLGRLVIPKEVRRTHGWEEGQPMEMFMDGGQLVVRAYNHDNQKSVVINELSVAKDMSDNKNVQQALQTAINFLEKGEIE